MVWDPRAGWVYVGVNLFGALLTAGGVGAVAGADASGRHRYATSGTAHPATPGRQLPRTCRVRRSLGRPRCAWTGRQLHHPGKLGQPGHAGPHVLRQALPGSGHSGGVGQLRWDASRVERDPVGPVLDVGVRREGRRPTAEHLLARPVGRCVGERRRAGTAGSSRRRPRGSPRRTRPAPHRSRRSVIRMGCSVIASRPQIGTNGGYCSPEAAQCTTTASRAMAASPSASTNRPGSHVRRWPSRTTRSIVRSRSSSHWASVGVFAIVGVTDRSMRSITPASSSWKNTSSGVEAAAAASMMSAAVPRNTAGSGWTTARLSIHGSRGRTQQMASGSTPLSSSQMQASVAVLPEPTITYSDGASAKGDQLVDGNGPYAVRDAVRRRGGRRDRWGEVAGVDDAPPAAYLVLPPGDARDEPSLAQVVAVGVEGHLSRGEQALAEHPVVVRADLRRGRPLVQAGFRPVLLQRPVAEQRRGHAVERGGLVQPDERVRVEPVPTDSVPAVDHDHADVRMVDQSVRERHPRRTCADHEVFGFQLSHRHGVHAGGASGAGQRPRERREALRRPPCTSIRADASSRCATSSGVRVRSAAPRFSSSRLGRRVPGIGAIRACFARSQASATRAGGAPLASAMLRTRLTTAWLACRALAVNRGMTARMSPAAKSWLAPGWR